MKKNINFRYISTSYSHSDNACERYDGHLTIHFRSGDFYPNGRNPIAHKQLDKLVKQIKPIIEELGIGRSVVNCNWGEWEDITFQYTKKENSQQIFDEVIKLAEELLN